MADHEQIIDGLNVEFCRGAEGRTGELDDSLSSEQGKELATFYEGKGTLDIVRGVSHEGILLAIDWREGADAIHAWLCTNGFDRQVTDDKTG